MWADCSVSYLPSNPAELSKAMDKTTATTKASKIELDGLECIYQ